MVAHAFARATISLASHLCFELVPLCIDYYLINQMSKFIFEKLKLYNDTKASLKLTNT